VESAFDKRVEEYHKERNPDSSEGEAENIEDDGHEDGDENVSDADDEDEDGGGND